jgi:uncharacterized damage-inducible protein DinB
VDPLEIAFRYNAWANAALIDFCSDLTHEQLAFTLPASPAEPAPGRAAPAATERTRDIEASLTHLLAAEQRYLFRLTGDQAERPLAGEKFPLDVLRAEADVLASRWKLLLAGTVVLEKVREARFDGSDWDLADWVVVMQVLHHGNDHRSQVCTLLGTQGLAPPELDVWAFAESSGGLRRRA